MSLRNYKLILFYIHKYNLSATLKRNPITIITLGSRCMSKGQTLQDPFLNALRREKIPVSIYLVNGIKLQGQVESFDQFVVLLKNSVSQMVYKHAISTIVPTKNVSISGEDIEEPSE